MVLVEVVVVLGYFWCFVFGSSSSYLIDWFDSRQKTGKLRGMCLEVTVVYFFTLVPLF